MKVLKSPWFWLALIILACVAVVAYREHQHKKEMQSEREKHNNNAFENANNQMFEEIRVKMDSSLRAITSLDSNYKNSLYQQSLIIRQFHTLYGEIDKAATDNDSVALWGIINKLCADHSKTPLVRYR